MSERSPQLKSALSTLVPVCTLALCSPHGLCLSLWGAGCMSACLSTGLYLRPVSTQVSPSLYSILFPTCHSPQALSPSLNVGHEHAVWCGTRIAFAFLHCKRYLSTTGHDAQFNPPESVCISIGFRRVA